MSSSLEYLCKAVSIVEDANDDSGKLCNRRHKRSYSDTFNNELASNILNETKKFKSYSASCSPRIPSRLEKAKEISRNYTNLNDTLTSTASSSSLSSFNHDTFSLNEYNLALINLIEQQKLFLLSQLDPYLLQYQLSFYNNSYTQYLNYLTQPLVHQLLINQPQLTQPHQQLKQDNTIDDKKRASYQIIHNLKENWCELDAVNEHFKRSLGKDYDHLFNGSTQNLINNQVDDHFARALGQETWSKLKLSHKAQ